MPFPLPIDPEFRKIVIEDWLQDADDRIGMGDVGGAKISLRNAHDLILSLPAGGVDLSLEQRYLDRRVKIEQ
jgi:hypothetical protein